MKYHSLKLVILSLIFLYSCSLTVPSFQGKDLSSETSLVKITFLQLNDIYEITPVSNGRQGGLARVATIKKQLLHENPNTFTFLAGDLFSPSALGTAKVHGERLDGKQIVDVMNHLGLEFITFGNHEFDLEEEAFSRRMEESQFTWIASNVLDKQGRLFPRVNDHYVLTVKNESGTPVRIGIFGLTIDSNRKPYVKYIDFLKAAEHQIKALKEKEEVDILVGLTHLAYKDDVKLVKQFPEIDLVMGGHEHENIQLWRGEDFTPILKADANARSVYIHKLTFDTQTREVSINSQLLPVTEQIKEDPQIAQVVDKWVQIAYQAFEKNGFQPQRVIVNSPIALDGLESSVRNKSTALTQLIAEGMLQSAPGSELAIFNSGSIRIDDVIPSGEVTEYDVIRILPFGGKVLTVEIPGTVLRETLSVGLSNRGSGGFLQTANVQLKESQWLIQNKPLDTEKTYKVAINDFLVSGREQNLGFLKLEESGIRLVKENEDIRKSLIQQLQMPLGSSE